VKVEGEILLDLYYSKSCFWRKPYLTFWPFGWLLTFAKAKAGSKVQPKRPLPSVPTGLYEFIFGIAHAVDSLKERPKIAKGVKLALIHCSPSSPDGFLSPIQS
jgi:hypothetical protein